MLLTFVQVAAVLANNEIMLTIRPGEHGSTYGGNVSFSDVPFINTYTVLLLYRWLLSWPTMRSC